MLDLIKTHGRRAPNAAFLPTAHFGTPYDDFVASLAKQVRRARSSQKVALAIPPTTVTKGTSKTITLRPQVDFKGEKLVISDSTGTFNGVAGYFTVDSIKVGRDEQFVASGAIPAQVFAQTVKQTIGLNMKTCPTSLQITLTVTNHDAGADHVFAGMLVGQCGGCNDNACGVPNGGGATYEPLVALAIPATNVAKGATSTISFNVEVPFTGQTLVVPTSWYDATNAALEVVSDNFEIVSIKVGRDEMLTSADPLPASVFAINSQVDVGLSMKKCPTSLQISVTVTNLDAANPHEFAGAFYGFCGDSGDCNTGYCSDMDIGVAAPVYGSAPGAFMGRPVGQAMQAQAPAAPGAPGGIY